MSKIYQISIYKEIKDEAKLAAYAELAAPALRAGGGHFLARGMPVGLQESGEKTRTVLLEWNDLDSALKAYDSPEYQRAMAALGDGAVRDIRYVEAV
jgi:uncharacterized protein (DUF1330 family)